MWSALEKEQQIAAHLKVRRWNHRGPERISASASVHHALELCWLDQGVATYDLGRERFEVVPGQLMVVPAGVEHATAFQGYSRASSLWLSAEAVAELDARLGGRYELAPGPAPEAAALLPLAAMLHSEAFSADAGALMGADALSEALALKVLRVQPRSATPGPRAPGIRRAVEHIEAHYAEPLTLDVLARTAAMSRFHFSRLFHEQVGKSPYAYLLHVRLRRAAELLGRGRANVTEAAYAAGFTDLGRFGRRFKGTYGCTPSEFAVARS
jgi:AraC family transcriptional regulator